MKRIMLVQIGFCICLAGCGPMITPMVPRLETETQKSIDESWEKALAPTDRLDHQVLLDVLVATQAYQLGVDKLYFRSEKRYSGGLVVMEIHFDRETPKEDRFDVKVFDKAGRLVREERYERKEVEQTYDDLFVHAPRPLQKGEQEPPEFAAKRAVHQARVAKIHEIFPKLQNQKRHPSNSVYFD